MLLQVIFKIADTLQSRITSYKIKLDRSIYFRKSECCTTFLLKTVLRLELIFHSQCYNAIN